MSMNKKGNENQNKNLLLFIKAASTCIQTSSFEKLTVHNIVEVTGLSRQTFYRRCDNKYDMINRYLSDLFEKSYDKAEALGQLRQFPEHFVDSLREEKDLIASACIPQGYDNPLLFLNRILYDRSLDHILLRNNSITTYQKDLLESYCESFVRILGRWLQNEIIGDSKEIGNRILDVMPVKLKMLLLL